MHWRTLTPALVAAASVVWASRGPAHARTRLEQIPSKPVTKALQPRLSSAANMTRLLNAKTAPFAVNGSAIPDVDFDIGESYAGELPISSDADEPSKMFFWFFPSTNPDAEKEILIWLNGGPGCSSLEGLLQENGPFLWQYGTFKPYANPWSWHTLTNVIYVDQPVGTGFSTGHVTATNEEDVAAQFMGFWKNFIDLFDMHGYKVYISGESYAGVYCPYIASAFLDADDTTYYNMSGMLLYNPAITWGEIQGPIPTAGFTVYWAGLFPFNDTFRAELYARDHKCGYTEWVNKYLVYPPQGHIPLPLPGTDGNGKTLDTCYDIYFDAIKAATAINPCFDVYQIATTCPVLWDVLGFPGSFYYLPQGATLYFDRADVKQAIHAPDVPWAECAPKPVFVGGSDNSAPSSFDKIPNVIDRTKNVIIAHGDLDMRFLGVGTLLAIQNMSWGGEIGFQKKPFEPFYVPYHNDPDVTTLAGAGVLGTVHSERGLTYVGVAMSGHMVPQYAPTAAYRNLEFLLGRVDCMDCPKPFTVPSQSGVPQSTEPLGCGTVPP